MGGLTTPNSVALGLSPSRRRRLLMKIPTMFIMPLVLLSIALACSSGVNPPDGIGEARMEVTQVPPGVGCLRVVAAATRSVQFDFNVSPGTNSVFNLSGIPTG